MHAHIALEYIHSTMTGEVGGARDTFELPRMSFVERVVAKETSQICI